MAESQNVKFCRHDNFFFQISTYIKYNVDYVLKLKVQGPILTVSFQTASLEIQAFALQANTETTTTCEASG